MNGIFMGVVEKVLAPNSPQNISKYQYEYTVMVSTENYAQIKVINAIIADSLGQIDDFQEVVLDPGARVLVMFVNQSRTNCVILSGLRNYSKPMTVEQGQRLGKRFNRIETGIDKTNSWYVKSDFGPYARVEPAKIILDDSVGQKVTIDKETKTITIESELWNIDIRKDVTMKVGGNVNATITGNVTMSVGGDVSVDAKGSLTAKIGKNANIEVKENVTAKCKQLDAKVETDATIKAGRTAKIDAKDIQLNGQAGRVLTTITDPYVDMITGLPSIGVPNVKAGGGS